MRTIKYPVFIAVIFLICCSISQAEPANNLKPDTRCPVCGMFVAKYETWVTQIQHSDGTVFFFDGAKDMLAYYSGPEHYGKHKKDTMSEVWVKDYYTLEWIDATKAFYVIGSDVYGPMGHEFIPFALKEAAEAFQKDHKGKRVLAFDDITPELVEELRTGQKMKH